MPFLLYDKLAANRDPTLNNNVHLPASNLYPRATVLQFHLDRVGGFDREIDSLLKNPAAIDTYPASGDLDTGSRGISLDIHSLLGNVGST